MLLLLPAQWLAAAELAEARRREEALGIAPDKALDDFMAAMATQVCGMFAGVWSFVMPCCRDLGVSCIDTRQ